MLDIQLIRDEPDRVRQAMRDKRIDNLEVVDTILEQEAARRDAITRLQDAQTRSNTVSKEIGLLMREGKRDEAQERIAETGQLKEQIKTLEDEVRDRDAQLHRLLLEIPNIPHESVPVGSTPDDNEVVLEEGDKPTFDFEPVPHWALIDQHGLVDFERGAKVTGAGFPFYVDRGARLQRALVQFFLDLAVDEGGYQEIQPPILVNTASATGTGQLPDKEGQMYRMVDQPNEALAGQTTTWLRHVAEVIFWISRDLIDLKNEDFFPKSYDEIALPAGEHTATTLLKRHLLAENFLNNVVRDIIHSNAEKVYSIFEILNNTHFNLIMEENIDEDLLTEKLTHDYLYRGKGSKALIDNLIPQSSNLYPVPTAEIPVTNFFRDEILDEARLPIKFCAYTPNFRREAGSYGKEVRGLNRLHQFDKVELVQFTHPDQSYDALEAMRGDAERAIRRLGLPFRRLLMCTGDMGFTQAKKYDLEVWSAGQQRWLEVSSISNMEAFQARRTQIRYRAEGGGKPAFVHTLNGSGLALPRIVAALLENNQQADSSIVIPEALRKYTGFERIG